MPRPLQDSPHNRKPSTERTLLDLNSTGFLFASLVTIVTGLLGYTILRFRKEKQDTAILNEAVAQGLHIPPSLHPVIDPQICIGSLSCLKVCPEGDILGVVDGKAALITASNCIGHGRCALECPVDAIKLVFGTSERGVDLPEIDQFFESSRPGVHIVGELGGMGLIKNAITQGVQVSDYLRKTLVGSSKTHLDVVIIGAGPAGMATALRCKELGLSFQILEQESVGGTIAHYPRQKIVMVDPVQLPFHGSFGKREISKEELLDVFHATLKKASIEVLEGTKILSIEGADGAFSVSTSRGAYPTRKVILATGRRGTPRTLGVPGEDLEKVTYRLIDPEQYVGKKVLVVGGGDSALEAAIMLAEEGNISVSISYRNPTFGRCRPANREKIDALIAAKKIRPIMNSQITKILEKSVHLTNGEKVGELPNDYVIVCIGGELPQEFLTSVGVQVKRYFGEAPKTKQVDPSRATKEDLAEERHRRRLTQLYFLVGTGIVAFLAYRGWEYYKLPQIERVRSPMHHSFRSGGFWGHGIGIAATLVMLSNFLYSARKRWRILKGRSSIRNWLSFHMFVGFMSPLVIIFHAAFQSNNVFATSTFVALLIVVTTGIVGRFIFGLIPAARGKQLELSELRARWEEHKIALQFLVRDSGKDSGVSELVRWVTALPEAKSSPFQLFLAWPIEYVHVKLRLLQARRVLATREQYLDFRDALWQLIWIKRQLKIFSVIRKLLSIWRIFHVILALFLVVLIGIHIYITTYYGYRWIF